jgi:integrase
MGRRANSEGSISRRKDGRWMPVTRSRHPTEKRARPSTAPRALEALRRHRISQNEERLKSGASWEDNDLIFPTRKVALMRRLTFTDDPFKPLLDRVGLPRTVRFHDLHHIAATLLLGRASETCTGTIGAFVHRNYAG